MSMKWYEFSEIGEYVAEVVEDYSNAKCPSFGRGGDNYVDKLVDAGLTVEEAVEVLTARWVEDTTVTV